MMRTIPEIRARMIEMAKEHGLPELAQLAEETRRRRPVQRAPARRQNPDEAKAERIREYAARHPRTAYHDIANTFRTTIGRVSEALAGKRKPK